MTIAAVALDESVPRQNLLETGFVNSRERSAAQSESFEGRKSLA
jgi:hypothetical protein